MYNIYYVCANNSSLAVTYVCYSTQNFYEAWSQIHKNNTYYTVTAIKAMFCDYIASLYL